MAKSKYEYVKNFEAEDKCLPNCWIVVNLDGKCFQRFAEMHGFEKPNDKRSLELMSRSAAAVMEEIRDIVLAYGQSDEYSFVFRKDTGLFNRRTEKILTIVNSLFSAAFVFYWKSFLGFTNMLYPPAFEGHVYLFPSELNLKDYLSWRQIELHANNLYSSAFWAMVLKGKLSPKEAEEKLRPIAFVSHRHELILKDYGIIYGNEPILFRKGTTLVRKLVPLPGDGKFHQVVFPLCIDLTNDEFWRENSEILGLKPLTVFKPGNNNLGFPIKRQMNDMNGDISMKPNMKPAEIGNSANDAKIKPFDRRMSDVNIKNKQDTMGK
ncbi:hypothetical protein PGB90_006407 [Kerria lacca]